MRHVRLLIGILAVIVAIWIVVGEQMAGASGSAVVNAQVVTLRTDTAGTLRLQDRTLGTRISSGETLAMLEDPLVDAVRLDDLRMERDLARAELAAIRSMIEKTEAHRTRLQARSERFRTEHANAIRTRLDHAKTRLSIMEETGLPDAERQELIDALDAGQTRLPLEPLVSELALDHARERVATLEITLRTAEAGVLLNDRDSAEQRALQLERELARLKADAARANHRITAVEERVAREQVRVNERHGGEIASPVDGLYWEILQADGVNVQRGDPILRVVDCTTTKVTLSVSERVYNTLSPGQAAQFRMTGGSRTFDATVARLGGSGAATLYRNLAVAPSQRHLERFDVMLIVPQLNADPDLGCAIGRTGRAFFDRRPLDWWRGLFG